MTLRKRSSRSPKRWLSESLVMVSKNCFSRFSWTISHSFAQGLQQAALGRAVPARDELHRALPRVLLQGFQQGHQQLGVGILLPGEGARIVDLQG